MYKRLLIRYHKSLVKSRTYKQFTYAPPILCNNKIISFCISHYILPNLGKEYKNASILMKASIRFKHGLNVVSRVCIPLWMVLEGEDTWEHVAFPVWNYRIKFTTTWRHLQLIITHNIILHHQMYCIKQWQWNLVKAPISHFSRTLTYKP